MVYSNFRCITHSFRDSNCFIAENHILPTQLVYLTLNLKVMHECGDEIWRQKTRIMGLPYREEIMIAGRTMWAQSMSDRLNDRGTDGQTDLQ